MATVSQEDLLQQLNWRYAVKIFDDSKRIPESTLETLEDVLVLSPSSFGLQPWKFVVIGDQSLKDQLPEVSWNQSQPKDCSHTVLGCALGYRSADDKYATMPKARYAKSEVIERR
ncbi:MAG: nitroreductase family protein [Opitutaceae bacterium]|nr:nitroreductase family protein [Opitutaceae bacterium]